jgi:hypothetical protein
MADRGRFCRIYPDFGVESPSLIAMGEGLG